MPRMSKDDFLSVIQAELNSASAWAQDHIAEEQLKNLQYYLGMPLGNEIKGRSQVVSWDVFEAVESALPGFIEPFFSSDKIGTFAPRGPEDEAFAEQATDYVNYIIKAKNDGFNLFNTWLKDALLSKIGVVRADWVPQDPKRIDYTGLLPEQVAMLLQDETVEVLEQRGYASEVQTAQGPVQQAFYDVSVAKKQPGQVQIENIRPENFVISSGAQSLKKARVIGDWVVHTRSELKQLGYSQHASVTSYDRGSAVNDQIDLLRTDSSRGIRLRDAEADETLEEVELFRGYVLSDFNGDGIAEWRRVLVGGGDDPILENEEATCQTYAVFTPIPIPHRVIGLAYADVARPIADIKTALTRQYFDSLYLANRPRTYVNVDAGVSLDDLLSDRIGGIVRGRGPAANALQPLQTTIVSRDALEGLQLVDTMRETRLGIPKFNPGLEADALHKTATGVRSINNLVDKRQKMTLRCFAETGIKDLFRIVLKLVTEYQDVEAVVRLRGKFVSFDPRGWNPDMDCIVEAGVGTSDETETMMLLQQFGQYMTWAQQFGVVTPPNVYQYGLMLAKNARLKGADERLLTDPARLPPPPPPPPDPKIVAAKIKAQSDAAQADKDAALQAQLADADARRQMLTDQNRQEMEARQKQLEMQQAAQLEQMRMQWQREAEAMRLGFERWKVEFQAVAERQLEALRASLKPEPPEPAETDEPMTPGAAGIEQEGPNE